MKKKAKVVMMILGVLLAGSLLAQPGGGGGRGREKIEAMKVGFITQKLNLSTEEAQRFWPVYNKYTDEMEKSRKSFRGRMMDELSDLDNMSDAEAEKTINDFVAFKSAEVELLKKYTAEFKKVLPSQKVVKLYVAEQEFKKELLKRLREQR